MQEDFRLLYERHPLLVPPNTVFECYNGWIEILDRFFNDVDAVLPQGMPFRIRQIKEKWAELRIYAAPVWPDEPDEPGIIVDFGWGGLDSSTVVGNTPPVDPEHAKVSRAVRWAIMRAEARSALTCEKCGRPGVHRIFSGRHFTACDEHADGGESAEKGTAIWGMDDKRWVFDPERDDFIEYVDGGIG